MAILPYVVGKDVADFFELKSKQRSKELLDIRRAHQREQDRITFLRLKKEFENEQ